MVFGGMPEFLMNAFVRNTRCFFSPSLLLSLKQRRLFSNLLSG